MSNSFRTGNIDTRDLFSDDLTTDSDTGQTDIKGQTDSSETESSTPTLAEPVKAPQEIIDELDSLRFVLNEGPEFQQDIPLLEDIENIPAEIAETLSTATPADIDVPILTDTCDSKSTPPDTSSQASLSDIARANIDSLLDQLVTEYLPMLESRLRAELDKKIRTVIDAGRISPPPQESIAIDNDTSID